MLPVPSYHQYESEYHVSYLRVYIISTAGTAVIIVAVFPSFQTTLCGLIFKEYIRYHSVIVQYSRVQQVVLL